MAGLDLDALVRSLILDVMAIAILAYALYYRRHGRRDLMVGYVAFNISLFTVASALGSGASVTIGFGFGLFAVLSIVRLRSDEATQAEIGYTMTALVLGLLVGLPGVHFTHKALFSALLVLAMYVIDHPRLFPPRPFGRMLVVLDSAITDHDELIAELERRLGSRVRRATVLSVDFRRKRTRVDVRLYP